MRDSKSSLKNIRVLKKNMLFIQSYDDEINRSVLKRQSFYECCGEVEKIKIKQNYKNHTAYVTYASPQSAASAFIALFHLNQRMKILFGTVQYCKYFIRRSECRNEHCVFLHLRDRKNEIIVKDEIDQDVYEEHYDMAVRIAEDQAFQTVKKILNKREQLEDNLIIRGLRKAAEVFHLMTDIKLEVVGNNPHRKLSQLQESLGSTTEQSVNQGREQPPNIEIHSSQSHPNTCQDALQANSIDSQSAQQVQNVQKPLRSQQKRVKQSDTDDRLGDYIRIQLVKKLMRESNSKLHNIDQEIRQQIHKKSNLMLFKIVKNQ